MCCPNVGANFWSQYLSHMMPNLSRFLLEEGDGCAQFDQMDLDNKS